MKGIFISESFLSNMNNGMPTKKFPGFRQTGVTLHLQQIIQLGK